MTFLERIKNSKRLHRIILVVLGLVVLYTVCGFFVLPPVLKSVLQNDLTAKLHRRVTVRTVAVNPYVLSVTLKDLTVRGATPAVVKFAAFKKLYVNLQIMSLFKWACIVKQFTVTDPYLKLIRTGNEQYNFSDLMKIMMKPAKTKATHHTLGFSIDNIEIKNGTIAILDQVKQKHYTVKDITLHLPFISNLRYYTNIWVKPLFKANVNGSTFSLKGETKPFARSHATIFNVAFNDIDLPSYLKYSPFPLRYKLPSGKLSIGGKLSFLVSKKNAPVLKFDGDIQLTDLQVTTLQGKDLLQLPQLKIAVARLEPFAGKLVVSKLSVHEPRLHLRRNQQGKLNLLALLQRGKPAAGTPDKSAAKSTFSWDVKHLKVDGGTIFFTDDAIPTPFQTTLEGFDLTVKNLGDAAGHKAGFQFSARSKRNSRFAGSGDFTLSPFSTDGTVQLTDLPIGSYSPYYDRSLLFKVRSGSLSCRLNYQIRREDGQAAITLSGIQASVSSLDLQKPGQKGNFFAVPEIAVSNGSADLASRRILIGTLQTERGTITVVRNKAGKINLEGLLSSAGKPPKATGSTRQGGSAAWNITLKNGVFKNYQVQVRDQDLSRPLDLNAQKIDLTLQNIATAQTGPGHLSLHMQLGTGGSASCAGTIQMKPLSANLKIKLHGIDITPFQGYLRKTIEVLLTTGRFSADGNLLLRDSKTGGFRSSYHGNASIDNVTTVAAATSDDLLNWKKLTFAGIDAGNAPLHFDAGQITLSGYYAHVWIDPHGKINLFALLHKHGAKPAAKPKSGGPFSVKIAKVQLQNGRLTFDDQSVHPQYRADLTAIGGTVRGLDSTSGNAAAVTLQGTLDNSSPLKIDGRIDPFPAHFGVDVKTTFSNISLIPMNPFARTYIGYHINKGKLSLDLQTKIHHNRLDSQNRIELNQLTLGRKVPSPNAIDAPIKFAISLLENRQGLITLDIPITGNLNAPQFSLDQVIANAVQGLLGKIVSSPFTLLAGMVGAAAGGQELKYVQFPYGSGTIDAAAAKKLHTLAAALYQRPHLQLDIAGHVDPTRDKKALQEEQLTLQLKKLFTKGRARVPLQQVALTPQEYDKYLRQLYEKDHPRISRKTIAKLSSDTLKARMLSQMKVTRRDLRALAHARATGVEAQLLKSGKITGSRIFIVREQLAAKPHAGVKASRVTLTLN